MSATPPQELLDQLHALGITALFSPVLSAEEKAKTLTLIKQKLRLIKRQLGQEMTSIKAQWDGRNAEQGRQERLHLAPYQVLDNLASQIEIALSEYEMRGSTDWQPDFGTQIVGNFERAEWHILPVNEVSAWQHQDAVKEIAELREAITRDERKVREIRDAVQERKNRARRSAIYLLIASGGLILGALVFVMLSVEVSIMLFIFAFFVGITATIFWNATAQPDHRQTELISSTEAHKTQSAARIGELEGVIRELGSGG